jgi:hypothetical protein
MPSRTYTLFRNAILAEQQMTCIYEGRYRELCPHIIGHPEFGDVNCIESGVAHGSRECRWKLSIDQVKQAIWPL